VFDRSGLDRLVDVLIDDGYRVIGPTVRDNSIVLAELESAADLPAGWGVDTGPGHYRLRQREDAAVFANSAGPQSWKPFLHPPRRRPWSAGGDGGFRPAEPEPPRYAFLGVRGCDLAAIHVLGRVPALSHRPPGRPPPTQSSGHSAVTPSAASWSAPSRSSARSRKRSASSTATGPVAPRAATGHGISEAPRGLLYHRYDIGSDGLITAATIIPPTSQNQAAIEDDLRRVISAHLARDDESLTALCEQAIRNHDPCISCAAHFLSLTVQRL
jgi:hypothetical protein